MRPFLLLVVVVVVGVVVVVVLMVATARAIPHLLFRGRASTGSWAAWDTRFDGEHRRAL